MKGLLGGSKSAAIGSYNVNNHGTGNTTANGKKMVRSGSVVGLKTLTKTSYNSSRKGTPNNNNGGRTRVSNSNTVSLTNHGTGLSISERAYLDSLKTKYED